MRHTSKASGLFLALLAVVAQLALASVVPAQAASLADVTVLCQHDGNPGAPTAPQHQSSDCLLCFFCHLAAGPPGVIAAAPMLLPPQAMMLARAAILPPATAPPVRIVLAARPRGPPIPV